MIHIWPIHGDGQELVDVKLVHTLIGEKKKE